METVRAPRFCLRVWGGVGVGGWVRAPPPPLPLPLLPWVCAWCGRVPGCGELVFVVW